MGGFGKVFVPGVLWGTEVFVVFLVGFCCGLGRDFRVVGSGCRGSGFSVRCFLVFFEVWAV